MPKQSNPLEFLAKAQEDPKLSARVLKAVEKGGRLTAAEVVQIAKKAGFSFTRQAFEKAVRRSIEERFAAGERDLATMVNAKNPPESSCAKGCLSYTISWHPPERL
jgi:Nif11 domain